ncbi:MAG: hypothetical protein IJM17_04135 [Firmicutes bacterium]|nr:hypothetical protein [Bacillota bacterium]
MLKTEVKAFAKVNFILNMLGTLPSGYHELESFMQAVDLCDSVSVEWEFTGSCADGGDGFSAAEPRRLKAAGACEGGAGADLEVCLSPGRPDLPCDEKNLAYKAAVLMHEAFHPGVKERVSIKIEKNIPVAAGLAGGSADGAAVVTALGRLWGLIPESPEAPLPQSLLDIAAKLGSDVPFSLMAQNGVPAAVARGTGTLLTPAEPFPCCLLLMTSPFGVSTKAVYQALRDDESGPGAPKENRYGDVKAFISAEAAEEKVLHMGNQLTAPALRVCPEIGPALERLKSIAKGALAVQLSGSGPTCFAVYPEDADEEELRAIKAPGLVFCRTLADQ